MTFLGFIFLIWVWMFAEYKELQRQERVEKIAEVIQ